MRIGIVGLGSIGEVVVQSFQRFKSGVNIVSSVRDISKIRNLKANPKYRDVTIITNNRDVARSCDYLYLCVKPLQAKEICKEIKGHINESAIIISVMAGVPMEKLQKWLGTFDVVKIMPSITVAYNGPVVVYDPNKLNPQLPFFPLFNVDLEMELDRFTGESACIPGFLSFIFEEWIESLILLGMDSSLAEKVFIQNLVSYAQMIDGDPTRDHLVDIRNHVASKAGATERGLNKLKNARLSELFKETITIANNRVEEVKNLI